jgi:hypothetical protein
MRGVLHAWTLATEAIQDEAMLANDMKRGGVGMNTDAMETGTLIGAAGTGAATGSREGAYTSSSTSTSTSTSTTSTSSSTNSSTSTSTSSSTSTSDSKPIDYSRWLHFARSYADFLLSKQSTDGSLEGEWKWDGTAYANFTNGTVV